MLTACLRNWGARWAHILWFHVRCQDGGFLEEEVRNQGTEAAGKCDLL